MFYVGDDIELSFKTQVAAGAPHTADFDTGEIGETLTTSDLGSLYPFDLILSTPVYDDAHTYGVAAMKCAASGQGMEWIYASAIGEEYIRFYAYFTGYPSVKGTIWRSQASFLEMQTDGKLKMTDNPALGGGPRTDTTAAAIPLNQWVRIEIHITYSGTGTGVYDLKVFHSADSTTVTEQLTHTDWYTSTNAFPLNSAFILGALTGTWPSPAWFDNAGALGADWWGPYVAPTGVELDYEVRNWYGDFVSTGSFDFVGAEETFAPPAPVGGWDAGWYRCYLRGPETDALFGDSYGATNFCVIRTDSRFITMPVPSVSGGTGGEGPDYLMKGVLGIGTSRHLISNGDAPTTGASILSQAEANAAICNTYWADPGAPYADAARPRTQWCAFPNGSVDKVTLPGAVSGTYLNVYAKDETVDGATTFVKLEAGSASGRKITVYSPDSVTLVETYDNLANAAAAASALLASAYVRGFAGNSSAGGTQTVTAIGTAYHDGVVTVVSALYPLGVTRFEGPKNEGSPNAELAHEMRLFQASVHEGDVAAKAVGPSSVNIYASALNPFFAAGGGDYCDELAFHAYNALTNGDLNLGRHNLQALVDLLDSYGLAEVPVWQTESTQAMTAVYGVHHPRRARVQMMMTLLMEQYGIPRERNNPWYDRSHGFWGFPTWLANADGSLQPQCVLGRVLAEETFGQEHASILDFGTPGNNIFIGSIYTGLLGSTAVLMATSFMDNGSVTLTITGAAGPLTVVDGFGNQTVQVLVGGRVTVPLTDVPSYVRLPVGATASVYSYNGLPAIGAGWETDLTAATPTATIGATASAAPVDGAFITLYDYVTNPGVFKSANSPPENLTVTWDTPAPVDRVVIWCGGAWQILSTLTDFDVQTTDDGETWATRQTVTKTDVGSFPFGTDTTNVACQRETFWPEQWIHDVAFSPVTATGVRLVVRATSYGGEPDEDCLDAGGQGLPTQNISVQEIAVFGNSRTRHARVKRA